MFLLSGVKTSFLNLIYHGASTVVHLMLLKFCMAFDQNINQLGMFAFIKAEIFFEKDNDVCCLQYVCMVFKKFEACLLTCTYVSDFYADNFRLNKVCSGLFHKTF